MASNRHSPNEQAVSGAEQPERRQSRTTSRPSTLVEQPIVWDGVSLALPGETLSRRRERPAAATAEHTESSATESALAEQATAPDLQAVSSENAAIDTVFPPADAEERAPLVLEEEELDEESASVTQMPEAHDEAEFNPENASASHRVDPSSPSEFRLSSLFGRESEPAEKEQTGTAAQTAEPETEHLEHACLAGPGE